jgi:hypothetical protein
MELSESEIRVITWPTSKAHIFRFDKASDTFLTAISLEKKGLLKAIQTEDIPYAEHQYMPYRITKAGFSIRRLLKTSKPADSK